MASPPDGEAGHQPCGRVRLHDGEPLRIAVDLSASLPGNKINNNKMLLPSWSILARSHQYIIIFFKDGATVYLAPDNGDGLVAKGVAHQGGVLLHDRRPIVRTHLQRALSSCSGGLINFRWLSTSK